MRRKAIKRILALSLVSVILCGCQPTNIALEEENNDAVTEETSEKEKTAPYKANQVEFLSMKDYIDYMPRVSLTGVQDDGQYFHLPNVGDYTVMQGGCTDGKYAYFILENNKLDKCMIFKVDMATWTIVKQTEGMDLHHGNGMCYNADTNQIVVSHNTGAPKLISFIDADTLQEVGQKELDFSIYDIAYNAEKDWYVVGISGSTNFVVLDSNFVELGYYEGNEVDFSNQGLDCDENYIYIGKSGVKTNPGVEVVLVYNWMGEFQGIFRVDSVSEQEAVFHWEDKYYITFFTGNGGRVYEIGYDFEALSE